MYFEKGVEGLALIYAITLLYVDANSLDPFMDLFIADLVGDTFLVGSLGDIYYFLSIELSE